MFSYFKTKIKQRLYGGDISRMIAAGKIPDPEVSLRRLNTLGFVPKTIFDVGAYQGDFAQMCLNIWPDSEVHSFEGLPDKAGAIQKRFEGKNVQVVNTLVGAEKRDDVVFFADETSSSVLASQEFTPKKRLNLKMITLDDYVQQHNVVPGFLKIDTQGYEFPILQGFEQNLSKIPVILLELNTLEVYHHVTLAHEIIAFLASHDFVIYDICEIHHRPLDGALFQMDLLFVKKDSTLRADKRWDNVIE